MQLGQFIRKGGQRLSDEIVADIGDLAQAAQRMKGRPHIRLAPFHFVGPERAGNWPQKPRMPVADVLDFA